MQPTIFLIVPAITPDGPVKGAIALAKSLSFSYKVVFVSLKGGDVALLSCSNYNNIDLLDLGHIESWRVKRAHILSKMNDLRIANLVISFCFSADAFAVALKNRAIICSSIRANNYYNYKHTYGSSGLILAFIHYKLLRWFDRIYALDNTMAGAIKRYSGCDSVSIGNFIDEEFAEKFRKPFAIGRSIQLIFVGSLTERKQPLLFLRALKKLIEAGYSVKGLLLGDGPQRNVVGKYIAEEGLESYVDTFGFLSNPLELIASSDILVLPSLSEGAPRAALEALYLGLPCVLRNVDGNSHLINNGSNGILFDADEDLESSILESIKVLDALKSSCNQPKANLLPRDNRRAVALSKFRADINFLTSKVHTIQDMS